MNAVGVEKRSQKSTTNAKLVKESSNTPKPAPKVNFSIELFFPQATPVQQRQYESLQSVFKKIDSDNDGVIVYADWLRYFRSSERINHGPINLEKDWFLARDIEGTGKITWESFLHSFSYLFDARKTLNQSSFPLDSASGRFDTSCMSALSYSFGKLRAFNTLEDAMHVCDLILQFVQPIVDFYSATSKTQMLSNSVPWKKISFSDNEAYRLFVQPLEESRSLLEAFGYKYDETTFDMLFLPNDNEKIPRRLPQILKEKMVQLSVYRSSLVESSLSDIGNGKCM